ncbi:MAG: hypothetical protein ACK4TL_17090 [Hyphomicrobiaceae bacterium]
MSEIMRISPEKARQDPEAVFDRPADIEKEVGLTRGQKLATLKRWEADVERRLASTDEGMPSNDQNSYDADLLKEIKMAIDAIQSGEEPRENAR